ncbi:MAG: type I-F CRISPR-associated protein Csy1 [Methylococcaceae bacterium]
MKDKVLVDEFVDLIDGYKITKIDDLIKKIKSYLSSLSISDSKEFEKAYSNALEPVFLDALKDQLTEMYDFNFPQAFIEWQEEQKSEQYKSQSLRTKVANKVKKEITGQNTKESVKRVLNHYKLRYDLNTAIETVTQGLNDELVQIIVEQQVIWEQQLDEINEKYDYANWLDWASSHATNVSFATHIAKLTHSGISGASNVYFDSAGAEGYLSTSTLKNKEIEISQTNNALAPIGKLLQLKGNEESLSEQLKEGDLAVFEKFAKNDEQLTQWKNGFEAVFKEKEVATHYLAKQLYFPISNNDQACDEKNYHLINPMVSSSLDQSVFDKINFVKYSKEMTEVRKQKREGKFHQDIQISHPNLAALKVTASNHGNASPLNGKRSGKRYLLPSMPPTWQIIQAPPLNQKTLFSGEFEKRAWKSTKELQKYLIKLQNKEFGNKAIRDHVKQQINNVINILFDYAIEIQDMPSNWSENSKLKEAHALWLDNGKEDQTFQEKRKSGQWQDEVCQDFGLWMNSKLSNKDMKLVLFEKNKWAKLLKNRLSLFDKGWEENK